MKKRLSLLFLSFACLVAALLIMPAVTGIQAAAAQEVTMKRVAFPNKDITLVGNIFLPKDFDSARKYPAIICVHPAGSVKEQTAGLYARKLAEKGFFPGVRRLLCGRKRRRTQIYGRSFCAHGRYPLCRGLSDDAFLCRRTTDRGSGTVRRRRVCHGRDAYGKAHQGGCGNQHCRHRLHQSGRMERRSVH